MMARISAKQWTTEIDPETGLSRLVPAKAAPKFQNRRVKVDGCTFDSQGEANYWFALKMRQRAGEITDLDRQVTVPLIVNGQRLGSARLDFAYRENGILVYEDFKGMTDPRHPVTRLWKLKHAIIEATTGAKVRVVK